MSLVRSRLAAAATAVAAVLLLASPAPAGAAAGWSDPARILVQRPVIQQLRVGVDADGHVSIVGDDSVGLFALSNHSGGWQFVRLVTDSSVEWPIAGVFDRAGHSWIAWRHGCESDPCADSGIYLLTNRHGGPNHSWPATPTRLVDGWARDPAFQTSGDRLHLAYTDKHGRLHYRTATSDTGPWNDQLVWGDAEGYSPVMALDAHGRPNIVAKRFAGPGSSIGFAWARATGSPSAPSFQTRMVRGTGEFDDTAQLALDADGHARVAWAYRPYCGVGPCPPEPSRGTYTSAWTGSRWSAPKHLSTARPISVRITPSGRVKILTDRPSVVAQAASGWSTSVLLAHPTPYGDRADAGAMALTVRGKAVVVVADTVKTAAGWRWAILLLRER